MIYVVYHTYLVGNWEELVRKQLQRLIKSGLYDEADEIWVTSNIQDNSENDVEAYFSDYSKIKLDLHKNNNAEYPGIKKVKELGNIDNSKILYFHTKGVSNNWVRCESKEPSLEKIENVNSWRECMEYYVIDKWRECVQLLEDYDNVGVSCNGGWYWGNFWWSKSEHIKKTSEVGMWGRWDYEAWLNRDTPNSKNYEFFHMGYNPFLTKLTPELYNGELSKYKGKDIVIKKATYGTPPFEIDEGYSNMPLNVVTDVTNIVKKLIKKDNNKKISFNVNNDTMGSDPLFGYRKCMIIECYFKNSPKNIYRLGVTENHDINFCVE